MKALPESIARWFPEAPVSLGTDGFGRMKAAKLYVTFRSRCALCYAGALSALADAGQIEHKVKESCQDSNVDSEKPNPVYPAQRATGLRRYADRIQDARSAREYREWDVVSVLVKVGDHIEEDQPVLN